MSGNLTVSGLAARVGVSPDAVRYYERLGLLAGGMLAFEVEGGRVLGHALLGVPLNAIALALTAYLWLLVPLNLAYSLRPGTMGSYQDAWGGPLGVTNIRTFVDPQIPTRVAVLMDVADMDAVMAAMDTDAAGDQVDLLAARLTLDQIEDRLAVAVLPGFRVEVLLERID